MDITLHSSSINHFGVYPTLLTVFVFRYARPSRIWQRSKYFVVLHLSRISQNKAGQLNEFFSNPLKENLGNAGKVTETLGASRYREGSCRVHREGGEILIEFSLTSVLNKGCGDCTSKPSKFASQGDLFCKGEDACNLGRAAIFYLFNFLQWRDFSSLSQNRPCLILKLLCFEKTSNAADRASIKGQGLLARFVGGEHCVAAPGDLGGLGDAFLTFDGANTTVIGDCDDLVTFLRW